MANHNDTPNFRMGNVHTLVQVGTPDSQLVANRYSKQVYGAGADANDKALLRKWAKRKTITQKVALALIDAAKEKAAYERIKSYWNSYHCLSDMTVANGRVYGRYCKTRCCTICLAIRKAVMINKYLPVISKWHDPYFVTLTIKAPKHRDLKNAVNGMHRAFNQIKEKYKKKDQRNTGRKLIGLRSLECNFNPQAHTYNPHFHIIVPDQYTATTLHDEWLNKWTRKYTHPVAQHYTPINDPENVLIEIIKYGSKIFTEPDVKNKKNSDIPPSIYANALDNILAEFKGRRLLQSFGFQLPPQAARPEPAITEITDFDDIIFDAYTHDWISTQSGKAFTGYTPPPILNYLLNNGIDIEKA